MSINFYQIVVLLMCFLTISCNSDTVNDVSSNQNSSDNKSVNQRIFEEVRASSSGIQFSNDIKETKDINYYKYVYLYNGGGVGIGDINNDGLPDVYMTSTQGMDKLYLNKGDFKFEDISETSGIGRYPGYKTGITFVDINADGWLDIYVCRSGWTATKKDKENLLFINNKKNGFVEAAALYGLNDSGQSIQANFFDYDKDGDLDMYLGNHPQKFVQPIEEMIANVKNPNKRDSDKLYMNNGKGRFQDVSDIAGINNYCYSLGVVTGDLNNDGWTDIYVTSDFQPRDHYYVNQGDGTFKEELIQHFPHCSYFSMGVDLVDINGDKNLDLFTGEMLSEDNTRQKTNMAPMDMQRFSDMVNNGMHYQYMRNSLHLNTGNGHFSDVAHYAGLDKSDWSWSCLFGDYDQDGDDDLLVANGWLKDTQDKDFSKRSNKLAQQSNNRLTFEQAYSLLKSTPLENYAFSQTKDLKFEKVSKEWGFNNKGFSNGMAYGDLDNDGDLDIVVNNMNAPASVYRNTVNNKNFIKLKLNGPGLNKFGYNTKVELKTSKGTKYKELQVTRGFQSSSEPVLHFGLSTDEVPQSMTVTWPNGKQQVIASISRGSMTIDYDAAATQLNANAQQAPPQFLTASTPKALPFNHKEKYFDDYKVQVLLPHLLSQLGPALVSGDVNGDGVEDVFIGGAAGQAGVIFTQDASGNYKKSQSLTDTASEDVAATLFDADSDGDLDLYVVSGSNEFKVNAPQLVDRLYLNNGGRFTKDNKLLPTINSSGGCVAAADYDGDGDLDLFVGGRSVHGQYPNPAQSFLLENTPQGFKDVTTSDAPDVALAGMLTDAIWSDYDKDGDKDLIAVGEWTDILVFKNVGERLELDKSVVDKSLVGWWNAIVPADIDKDGDMDYIVGNLGENYKYQASDDEPFEVFGGDFDDNGMKDIVVSYHNNDALYPVRGFQCSSEQMPDLKKKIGSYEEFGQSDVFKVYGAALDDALHYKANCFSSMILWNEGGKLEARKLPYQAQLSPMQDFVVFDIDKDGDEDIIGAGNWFVSEVETPRADNGVGVLLLNEGSKTFKSVPWAESGFFAPHDVRELASVKTAAGKTQIIVANNNAQTQVFTVTN